MITVVKSMIMMMIIMIIILTKMVLMIMIIMIKIMMLMIIIMILLLLLMITIMLMLITDNKIGITATSPVSDQKQLHISSQFCQSTASKIRTEDRTTNGAYRVKSYHCN